ncbi:uncharacterized protein PITG_19002 [Phytophthora infestans T30-4]|uniref:Uncharacterized protein n=1 Tax=Phytophthora infestans (strain T30-4) TaxID=403677 RepID=D0NYQ8_PHYIT|nr:uncharacterized protein PITG_19002 [Phytophthora infestans T30-4]EEY68687.1 conserved hypothetical protein [Phytophthora infestans T30-4]|eukprot:XP_002997493.1 conserved hypothetical protein [Phytophthora infestans T30-4]
MLKFVAAARNRPEKKQKLVFSRLNSDATQVNGVLSNDRFTAVDVYPKSASDKVLSSLHPKRTASVNAVSENKQCKIGKTMVSAKRKGDKKIKHAWEEELLADEARISITHRGMGFVRAKQLEISPYEIDNAACKSLSHLVRTRNMRVEEATQFIRGEHDNDRRPNKAIDPERLHRVLRGYPPLDELTKIAEVGTDVEWRQGPMKNRPPPKNHGSCRRYLRAVTRSIREGQDAGQYMVVEAETLDRWSEITCSSLGAVVKKGGDPNEEVCTIHDLSFQKNDSRDTATKTEFY